jgi:hypothetical protein
LGTLPGFPFKKELVMKVSSLFGPISEGRDLLELFAEVYTKEQLVSRLERLKRQGTEELLLCIEGLRAAITTSLNDTLEMSADLEDMEESDPVLDAALDKIAEENDELETQNSSESPATENPISEPSAAEIAKNDVQTDS